MWHLQIKHTFSWSGISPSSDLVVNEIWERSLLYFIFFSCSRESTQLESSKWGCPYLIRQLPHALKGGFLGKIKRWWRQFSKNLNVNRAGLCWRGGKILPGGWCLGLACLPPLGAQSQLLQPTICANRIVTNEGRELLFLWRISSLSHKLQQRRWDKEEEPQPKGPSREWM